MTVRNLSFLFAPRSVAVIGASSRKHSVGATVLNNLIIGGFRGRIMPVNPKYNSLSGLDVYPDVSELPEPADLAIICTPPATVPGMIRLLGESGTRAAIVLTAGLASQTDAHGKTLKDLMLAAAKPYTMRILGPNCVGLLVPGIGLNASFAHTGALPGKIAFVSQSGAMVTGVLDWAKSRGIGFSKFVSLGEGADVDFGDVIDYLASDGETTAILLYIEGIRSARKFMSAARSAARSKPTLVVKAGRAPEGAKAATSHTGALAGTDEVYDAAIRRAGMLRVFSTEDLFHAVEVLARARPLRGEHLAILTNGGGPGVMATDTLIDERGCLSELSEKTMEQLDAVLPATWSRSNPVDIIGDAPVERYTRSMEILLKDPQADAVLFIHAPTAIVPSADIAVGVAPMIRSTTKNVLACWLGGDAVAQARGTFSDAGIPTYDTPEQAVRAFMHIVQYRRNQSLLMQVPSALSDVREDHHAARRAIKAVLADDRNMMSEPEAKALLSAYGIPTVQTRSVSTVELAVSAAAEIGFPVALKILSPDISHKSDVGGVALNLETPDAVRLAATEMLKRVTALRPDASVQGFSVQTMVLRPEARELIIGVTTDPVFGPVILFGQGGIAVEVTADHAIALPPLNMALARDLIDRMRVSRLLMAYRNLAAADIDAICAVLIQVSHLIIDHPEIVEMDINPLVADARGVIALDARIRVMPAAVTGVDRLAIRPYPVELEERISWQGAPLLLRPIRAEDGPQHLEFFNALDPEDVRFRIFSRMRELNSSQLARLTQIDYDREMAFIATRKRGTENAESTSVTSAGDGKKVTEGGKSASARQEDGEGNEYETIGVVRVIVDPDNIKAEFAIVVRSDMKGKRIGSILMEKVIRYCRERGIQEIIGETLPHNKGLLELVRRFGFTTRRSFEDDTVMLRLDLAE